MPQATLFLTVGLPLGLPGTGKTTEARRIEVEQHALRLTKDEWMKALYGLENPASASDVIEGRLINIALHTLELGVSVVVDYGLWGRDERSALRQAAAEIYRGPCSCGRRRRGAQGTRRPTVTSTGCASLPTDSRQSGRLGRGSAGRAWPLAAHFGGGARLRGS